MASTTSPGIDQVAVSKLSWRQVFGINFDHRQIRQAVLTDVTGLKCLVVPQKNRDPSGATDDVLVGGDVTILGDNQPRSQVVFGQVGVARARTQSAVADSFSALGVYANHRWVDFVDGRGIGKQQLGLLLGIGLADPGGDQQ